MRIARTFLGIALAAGFFALATEPAYAGKAGGPTLKIGVFDSRAVALAYGRSPEVADALPAIAREAGVVLIVSKWEMPFAGPSVETVDVTLPLAKLFKPDEKTLQIIEQLENQKPIPFEDLPLDPRM